MSSFLKQRRLEEIPLRCPQEPYRRIGIFRRLFFSRFCSRACEKAYDGEQSRISNVEFDPTNLKFKGPVDRRVFNAFLYVSFVTLLLGLAAKVIGIGKGLGLLALSSGGTHRDEANHAVAPKFDPVGTKDGFLDFDRVAVFPSFSSDTMKAFEIRKVRPRWRIQNGALQPLGALLYEPAGNVVAGVVEAKVSLPDTGSVCFLLGSDRENRNGCIVRLRSTATKLVFTVSHLAAGVESKPGLGHDLFFERYNRNFHDIRVAFVNNSISLRIRHEDHDESRDWHNADVPEGFVGFLATKRDEVLLHSAQFQLLLNKA